MNIVYQKVIAQLYILLSVTSRREDDARRERILLIILVTMFILSTLFTLSAFSLETVLQTTRQGISVLLLSSVSAIFFASIVLVKKGYWKIIRIIFITTLLIPTFYSLAHWGTLLPIPLLTLGLIILISGILFNTRFAILIAGIVSLYLGLITYLHQHSLLTVDARWLSTPLYPNYTFEIFIILLVITGITALAFSEIEANAKRARRSESRAKQEYKKIKEKIAEHTTALKADEQSRIEELAHFAEIGKISAGILHDLINPLTALSLTVNHLQEIPTNETKIRESIKFAVKTTLRIENLIKQIKLQLGQAHKHENTNIIQSMQQAIDAVQYSAHQVGVTITFNHSGQAYVMCTPTLVHRAFVNILMNAIESLEKVKREKPKIIVFFSTNNTTSIIKIIDNGPGLTRKESRNIFTPFYSTKPNGNGLGLSIASSIFRQELKAKITVKSTLGRGTTFYISW